MCDRSRLIAGSILTDKRRMLTRAIVWRDCLDPPRSSQSSRHRRANRFAIFISKTVSLANSSQICADACERSGSDRRALSKARKRGDSRVPHLFRCASRTVIPIKQSENYLVCLEIIDGSRRLAQNSCQL